MSFINALFGTKNKSAPSNDSNDNSSNNMNRGQEYWWCSDCHMTQPFSDTSAQCGHCNAPRPKDIETYFQPSIKKAANNPNNNHNHNNDNQNNKLDGSMQMMLNMGFTNTELNYQALLMSQNDVQQAVNWILTQDMKEPHSNNSNNNNNANNNKIGMNVNMNNNNNNNKIMDMNMNNSNNKMNKIAVNMKSENDIDDNDEDGDRLMLPLLSQHESPVQSPVDYIQISGVYRCCHCSERFNQKNEAIEHGSSCKGFCIYCNCCNNVFMGKQKFKGKHQKE